MRYDCYWVTGAPPVPTDPERVAKAFARVAMMRRRRARVEEVAGPRLRAARAAAGLTQCQVAARAGVSPQSWSLYERGQLAVPVERRAAVASAAGSAVAVLFADAS